MDYSSMQCTHSLLFLLPSWLTGGKVELIEVYENEGGVTAYRGGKRLCIIPAGCEYQHEWNCPI